MLFTPVAKSDDEQIHLHAQLLDAVKRAILAIRIQIPQKGETGIVLSGDIVTRDPCFGVSIR